MDIKLVFENMAGDIELDNSDLATDDGLETAVILSLFTDRLAETDDPLPLGQTDRRGWWGDSFSQLAGNRIGSRLWLLSRSKQTSRIVVKAMEYAEEALQWLVDDGIARAVTATASIIREGVLGLAIEITRPDGSRLDFKYDSLWEGLKNAV